MVWHCIGHASQISVVYPPVGSWPKKGSLGRGADLHMAQLRPLPLTVSCFSKIQISFTFLVPAHPGSPGKGGVKQVCVCVSIRHDDTRCYFNVRSKADISQLNLPHGTDN